MNIKERIKSMIQYYDEIDTAVSIWNCLDPKYKNEETLRALYAYVRMEYEKSKTLKLTKKKNNK